MFTGHADSFLTFVLHCGSNEGIDANELQLNIRAIEWHPFPMNEFIELNVEDLQRTMNSQSLLSLSRLTRSFLIV